MAIKLKRFSDELTTDQYESKMNEIYKKVLNSLTRRMVLGSWITEKDPGERMIEITMNDDTYYGIPGSRLDKKYLWNIGENEYVHISEESSRGSHVFTISIH